MDCTVQQQFYFDDTILESYIHPRRYKCIICSADIVVTNRNNFAKEKFIAHLEGDHEEEFTEVLV